MMAEFISFIFGLITGISILFYNDLKYNPYLRGYSEGYQRAIDENKKEGTP